MLLDYDVFEDELEKTIYKNSRSYLLKKIAENPNRYVGLFRTTSPKMKLMQNITQSHEISFGDFVENIITIYLGNFYTNLPKSAKYNNE
ncbi:MAG: restriction endonuclease, partial [Bacilli bacterium]